jgi:hypothetical protein
MLHEHHRLRRGFIAAVVALVIIAIPLRSTIGAPIVREWIGALDLEVTSWAIDGDAVTIDLAGSDPPPDAEVLAADLAAAFGAPVDLTVDYVAVLRQESSGVPA